MAGDIELEALEEQAAAQLVAKQKADETRAFVLGRFQHLLGFKYPLEIYSISNLEHHNCLIINDHFLLSYVEAEEILRGLEHA